MQLQKTKKSPITYKVSPEIPTPTLLQRIEIMLKGHTYLGPMKKPGWRGYLPHYLLKCSKHGYVVDYPHGDWDELSCPICMEEKIDAIYRSYGY